MIAGGLSEHFIEAIKINSQRSSYYQEQFLYDSLALKIISYRLILFEILGLPIMFLLDLLAYPMHFYNIPLFKEEIVPMTIRPKNSPFPFPLDPLQNYKPLQAYALLSHCFRLILKNDIHEMENYLQNELTKLQAVPCYNILGQHFLESIIRCCDLNQKYSQCLKGWKKYYTLALSLSFIGLSLLSIKEMISLDKRAAPFHAQGLAILYNDIPRIPLKSQWNPTKC
jgi:hypothetical protein